MKVKERFEAHCDRDRAVEVACEEETLLALFQGQAEIVERKGDRVTARTHYSALGREGTATFHFDYLMDGSIRFEKVCDGNVWRELRGELEFEETGDGCTVTLSLEGSTKGLVPEFTIREPMKEQIEQMANALRQRMEV